MKEIVSQLVIRYKPLCENLNSSEKSRMINMLAVLENDSDDWPIDKINRWIGFIQGVLYMLHRIDINEERDFTRPLFQEYYRRTGQEVPQSVDVTEL